MKITDKKEIIQTVRTFFDSRNKLRGYHIKSVYIINSLARGDFIQGVSDIDLLIIFDEETEMDSASNTIKKISRELNSIFSKLTTSHFGDIIDIAWEIHNNYKKSPLKCFKYFFDDLVHNNIHIYGPDILQTLNIDQPTKTEYVEKLTVLIKRYFSHKDLRQKNLDIGETIRYYLRLIGIKTLDKNKILKKLNQNNQPEILEFYQRYINNNTDGKEQEKLNEKIINKISTWLETPNR